MGKYDKDITSSEDSNLQSHSQYASEEISLERELPVFFSAQLLEDSRNRANIFRVFIARACFILLEDLCSKAAAMEALVHACRNDIMTDSGLLARTDELFHYFKKHRSFPPIRLIDITLIHGRALNTTLLELEKQLEILFRAEADSSSEPLDKTDIRRELARSIDIHVFAVNEDRPLLIEEYLPCLHPYKTVPLHTLYRISNEINRLICRSNTAYAAYTISASLNDSSAVAKCRNTLTNWGYQCIDPMPMIASRASAFQNYQTFQRILPGTEVPALICTIRILARDNQYSIVPYIFQADFDEAGFQQLAEQLDRLFHLTFRGKHLQDLRQHSRTQSELIAMILNHMLLDSVLKEAGITEFCTFDYQKISRNFGGDAESRRFFTEFMKKSKMKMGEYNQFLLALNCYTIAPFGVFRNTTEDPNEIRSIIDAAIYDRSVAAETVAYHVATGGLTQVMLRRGSKSSSLSVFLKLIYEEAALRNKSPDLRYVIAYLLYLMDSGYLAAITAQLTHMEGGVSYCHCMRVSELSLSIWPYRFRRLLPLLIEMERHCLWGWQDMQKKIQKYIGEHWERPELANDLWRFIKGIHDSGQNLSDWLRVYPAPPQETTVGTIENVDAYIKWHYAF